ncbi:MAG: ssl1498 family light-harvesting-like protein [Coleofasciculus sp. S288]|nr:ssl1498 family light-harvesting-like protein [Coleofasciculus sp. S288]
MYTTINQEGLLNNYALETPVYYAEYPNLTQQRRYALQGAFAILLVNFLVLIAFAVS